ncbi:MAG TPA: PhzF family phenazine biosynthesis protein [Candidatus Limnocylindria bacterium]|nr:PhzF family phenazine biosynthesis protein [Candidatus Limnocylindria bacterium]
MTRRFRYVQVDVFTDRPLAGNPLAVFPEATGLTDDEMQAVAREMNLSETGFVLPPTAAGLAAGADYRLRIFTPGMELPFAGHPSIGTAWVLASEGRFEVAGPRTEVRQELAVGVLPISIEVSRRGGRSRLGEVTMTQAQPELIHRIPADELAELAAALEVRARDLRWPGVVARGGQRRSPAVISCGLPFVVVPVSRVDLLADLDWERGADAARFAETYGSDTVALVAPGNAGAIADADVHVRMLSDPRLGILEDPATGSAAGPIGVFLGYLAGRRGSAHRVVIEQGVEVGRPSRLVAEIDFDNDGQPTRARVSGSTVAIAEGWLTLP